MRDRLLGYYQSSDAAWIRVSIIIPTYLKVEYQDFCRISFLNLENNIMSPGM